VICRHNVKELLQQREVLVSFLREGQKARKQGIPGIGDIIGGLDANFVLVQLVNGDGEPDNTIAEGVYTMMAETMGVVVRFRGRERGCKGAVRITVGTKEELQTLFLRLQEWQNSFVH
jgi:histidinol-phosphate aminotransferase